MRGNLGFIQKDVLPFEFKRIIFDVEYRFQRRTFTYWTSWSIDCFKWKFEVVLNDGYSKKSFILNKPNIDCTYQLVYGES
jgi:hypothetical protein